MRPLRIMTLLALVAAELATLVAIVFVLRNSVGPGGWHFARWLTIGGAMQAEEERLLPLSNLKGNLRISNDAGRIEVRTGVKDFGVRAVVYGYGWTAEDAQESLKLVSVVSTNAADGMRIVAKGPNSISGSRPRADLFVTVPAGITVDVDAGMGSVALAEFVGNATVDARMGRVDIDDFRGNLAVDAGMGRIDMRDMVIEDNLDVEANMGSISFRGRLGRKSNEFNADMGGIDIDLPGDHPALQLDAEWSMGSLDNSLPFAGDFSNKSAKGTLGEGAATGNLDVRASMGRIHIH